MSNEKNRLNYDQIALILRIGVGLVFFGGGAAKLSKLLFPSTQEGMVDLYLSPAGYVNQFFYDYLFSGGIFETILTPWLFLTSLSALELVAGIALLLGIGIRFFSLLFAFLCWTFVISLPVVNAPGFEIVEKTHVAPAILVMIRDIAISGILFVLYNLGADKWSLDRKLFSATINDKANWDVLGLLLRLSIGFVFIVGGAFYGMQNIKSFVHPALLIPVGLVLIGGNGVRYAGYAGCAILLWYMFDTMALDKGFIGNLNSVKREFAILASVIVLSIAGGGNSHTWLQLIDMMKNGVGRPAKQTQLANN